MPAEKPHYVIVTRHEEIAAINRGGLIDPIGGKWGEIWIALKGSLQSFRKRSLREVVLPRNEVL